MDQPPLPRAQRPARSQGCAPSLGKSLRGYLLPRDLDGWARTHPFHSNKPIFPEGRSPGLALRGPAAQPRNTGLRAGRAVPTQALP